MSHRQDSHHPSLTPSPQAERGQGGEVRSWHTSPELWEKLKPLARQMRHAPTPEENALWQRLRNRQLGGYRFRRQHALERFIVDFYCSEARLVVEVDGPIHAYTQEEDFLRHEYLKSLGMKVLRFSNEQIKHNLPQVLNSIMEAIKAV